MRLYHRTARTNLQSILEKGLLPGSVIGKGERIGAVLFDSRPYLVQIGHTVYLEVEIRDDDPDLRQLNARWWAYAGAIHPDQITAIADPPVTAEDLLELWKGQGDVALKTAFAYKERWLVRS